MVEKTGLETAQDSKSVQNVAGHLIPPVDSDTWIGLTSDQLPVAQASDWVVLPSCGGVVVFTGTARDHSTGRSDVTTLEYEAYEDQVTPKLGDIAAAIRSKWSDVGRIVLIHRTGVVPLTEAAVIVAVSAPHRVAAFEAARFGIDTLKSTVPIWKREDWSEGSSWGREAQHIITVDEAAADSSSVDSLGSDDSK